MKNTKAMLGYSSLKRKRYLIFEKSILLYQGEWRNSPSLFQDKKTNNLPPTKKKKNKNQKNPERGKSTDPQNKVSVYKNDCVNMFKILMLYTHSVLVVILD